MTGFSPHLGQPSLQTQRLADSPSAGRPFAEEGSCSSLNEALGHPGTTPVRSGGVREIPLSHDLVAIVDAADFDWLSQWAWQACRGRGSNHYAFRAKVRAGQKVRFYMHRLIARPAEDQFVDHANGDGLDNRRANLRVCSHSENMRNRGPWRGARYKGITRSGRKWVAMIQRDRRRHYLGIFASEVEAAMAYDRAARDLHGEFARLNFPEAA